jgi:antitoxin (DNA-binding transcriptional repressor) of toxin-antitoxin stability system
MKATILDLRYRMKDVLRAIDRGETVTVLYRGKEKARILPIAGKGEDARAEDQDFFGMWKDRQELADPAGYVSKLRQPRFGGLRKKR